MPLFKKKNTNKEKAKRASLITKILDDNRELTNSLKEHTELRNTLKNQIEQMRHDEDVIQKLKPKLQTDLKILEKGSKQLEKDQKALEKTFDKLTTKVTPPELQEIHQAYHDTEPTAPSNVDDTSSLPPYEKATSLYPSLLQPTPSFVIMDGIGQEEIAPVPSYVIENDDEEEMRPKSLGPAAHTRSKRQNALDNLAKKVHELSATLGNIPSASGARLSAPLALSHPSASGARSSGPLTSSPYSYNPHPPEKTPPSAKPRLGMFEDSIPEEVDDLSSLSDSLMTEIPPREPNQKPIPLREYSEYLAALPPFSKGTTVTKWINRILQMVPHGDGSTPHDRLLCNKMIQLLKKSGLPKGKEVAEALATLLQTDNPSWQNVLEMISQSFPSGIVELSDQIISCIHKFDWEKDNATLHFTPVFMEAGIPMKDKMISKTDHGLDYLSRIRRRLPEAIQVNLLGAEQGSWNGFFNRLQKYQNMIRGDKQRYLQDPNPPPISFPVQPQPRKSTRNVQPPNRYGQNVGYNHSRQPRTSSTSMFRLNNTSSQSPSFQSTLQNNETAMEKALQLPTGQIYQCYTCGRPGHKSSECLVKAVLDQCGKRLEVDPNTGYVTIIDRLPMTTTYKLRHDNEWLPFLRGQNALKKRIMSLRDLDALMRQYNEKSYREKRQPYQRPSNNSWQRTKQKVRDHAWVVPGQNRNAQVASHSDDAHSLTPQTSNTSLSSNSTGTSAPIFHQVPEYPYSFPRHTTNSNPSPEVPPEN